MQGDDFKDVNMYLHFIMLLLKLDIVLDEFLIDFDLHFIMLLLKHVLFMCIIFLLSIFTFHYASIKTQRLFLLDPCSTRFTFHYASIKTSLPL